MLLLTEGAAGRSDDFSPGETSSSCTSSDAALNPPSSASGRSGDFRSPRMRFRLRRLPLPSCQGRLILPIMPPHARSSVRYERALARLRRALGTVGIVPSTLPRRGETRGAAALYRAGSGVWLSRDLEQTIG